MMPQVELRIVRGQARNKQRSVNVPAFLIGASRDCDLVLGDQQFNEVHSYLIVHTGGVYIRHLGVGPKLFVNEREVIRSPLNSGDRLRTGPYEFVIQISDLATKDSGQIALRPFHVSSRESLPQQSHDHGLKAARKLFADIRFTVHSRSRHLRRPA